MLWLQAFGKCHELYDNRKADKLVRSDGTCVVFYDGICVVRSDETCVAFYDGIRVVCGVDMTYGVECMTADCGESGNVWASLLS